MPWHTNEELRAQAQALARQAGTRASSRSVGRTVRGEEILSVRLAAPGRVPDAARPQALVLGSIHGNEVIGSEVALALLRALAAPEPPEPARAVLDLADVTVVPAVNLDARGPCARALQAGALRAGAGRPNANRVDLNRNFPFPPDARDVWHPLAGTRHRWLPWHRGPAPLSEPEAQAVRALADETRPAAAVNLHSMGELFLYPYSYTASPPKDLAAFRAMGEAFTQAQRARAPALEPYAVKQARAWYAILGDLDDWLYDTHGTLSVTVELGRLMRGVGWKLQRLPFSIWWMNPQQPEAVVERAAVPCLRALEAGVRAKAAARAA